jgi:hypothetical protein
MFLNPENIMKTQIIKTTLFSLVAAALVAVPASSQAQDKPKTEAPAAAAPAAKKNRAPFHGKVTAVDTAAMTLSVGEMTVSITSDTKIIKDNKPATLSEIAVGDVVGGAYKKDDAGKLNATTIRVSEKDKEPKKEKKKAGEPAKKD